MNKPKFHSDPLTRIRKLLEENGDLKKEISRLHRVGEEYQDVVNRLTERIWSLEAKVHVYSLRDEPDDLYF